MWHVSPLQGSQVSVTKFRPKVDLIQQPIHLYELRIEKSLLKCSRKPVKGGLWNKRKSWELRRVAGVGANITGLGELSQGGPWKYWISFSVPSPLPTTCLLPTGLLCLRRRGLTSALWMKWAIKSEFRQSHTSQQEGFCGASLCTLPSVFRGNCNYLLRTCEFYF